MASLSALKPSRPVPARRTFLMAVTAYACPFVRPSTASVSISSFVFACTTSTAQHQHHTRRTPATYQFPERSYDRIYVGGALSWPPDDCDGPVRAPSSIRFLVECVKDDKTVLCPVHTFVLSEFFVFRYGHFDCARLFLPSPRR